MDPLSALGAVGSLLAIIEASGKLARRLYRVARGLKAAKKDIKRFASEVSIFSQVLYSVFNCLRDHYTRSEKLKIINNLQRKNLIDMIAKQATLTIGEVEDIFPQMKSLESFIKFWEKIKWLHRKPDVAELRLQMNSLAAAVNMLMSCINYEDKRLQGVDAKILKVSLRQMKNCNRTAEEINARHQDAMLQNGSRDSFFAFSEIQDVAIEVFEEEMEIVKIERAAAASPPEPDPSHLSRGRRSPRPYRNGHSRRIDAVASSRHATQSNLGLPRPITRHEPSAPVPADPEPPPAPASSPSNSPSAQTALVPGTFYPLANTAIPQGAVRRRRNDGIAQIPDVHPHQEPRHSAVDLPSAKESYEVVTVRISRAGSKTPALGLRGQETNARLYRDFSRNVMSQNLAVQLGLNIHFTSAGRDEVMAAHQTPGGDATHLMVGHVRFVCSNGTLAFRVRCLVSRHTVHGASLVLGRPYVEQMEEARNGRRGESLRACMS